MSQVQAQPPLIPGDATVSCGAVNKLFCVYGNMTMPNATSTLDINGTVDVAKLTAGTLNVTGSSVFSSGLTVREVGAAPKQGIATLVAGQSVVTNSSVTATSRIFLTTQTPGVLASVGSLFVYAKDAGTSFTVSSTAGGDTSVFAYEIFEKGA